MSAADPLAVLEVKERNELEALLLDFDESWAPKSFEETARRVARHAERRLGLNPRKIHVVDKPPTKAAFVDLFRRACRDYATEWIEVQKQGFRRCGVEGEWDDPYLTMNFESEAATVREFLSVAMGGRLVRGAKPVMWSPVERTALAEAEVEYHDRKVPVIWVKFPVKVHGGDPSTRR